MTKQEEGHALAKEHAAHSPRKDHDHSARASYDQSSPTRADLPDAVPIAARPGCEESGSFAPDDFGTRVPSLVLTASSRAIE